MNNLGQNIQDASSTSVVCRSRLGTMRSILSTGFYSLLEIFRQVYVSVWLSIPAPVLNRGSCETRPRQLRMK